VAISFPYSKIGYQELNRAQFERVVDVTERMVTALKKSQAGIDTMDERVVLEAELHAITGHTDAQTFKNYPLLDPKLGW
jgi:hypothetical protein